MDGFLNDERRSVYLGALDLLAEKLVSEERTIGVEFPYVTGLDGRWLTMPASISAGYSGEKWSHGNWFCGFWVGELLAAYLHTGDDRFLVWARERMRLVGQRSDDGNTHDIGFIFQSSATILYHLTGGVEYRDLAVKAAAGLRARLITTRTGAYISSWGPLDDERGRRSSAIDTMANLRLLYWAGAVTDDGSFRLAGEAHARMTRKRMVRDDYSTYHAVEYDLDGGERARGYTFQGYADESCWPRGQAWAILGFAETAQATGKEEYLELAIGLGDYFLRRTGGDRVPPWDFDDPAVPDTLRDSSAAAIAASGFLTIAATAKDALTANRWRERALSILDVLCANFLAREASYHGLLKHGVYSKPHNVGLDSAVMFGDYYFVESLMKVVKGKAFLPEIS